MHAVKKADVVFLLGLSGSGKTTLGSWLAEDLGMLPLDLDRVEGDGIDFVRGERRARADLVADVRRRLAAPRRWSPLSRG